MNEKTIITVFTPTYNRGYILENLYKSLTRQTLKNFIWLVIDDGSTDNTKELINKWQKENEINIKYIYQENQGMCGAHNTAYNVIDTELNICVDSDDYLVDNAIELIINKWNNCDKENTAGIIALDAYLDGKVVGTKMPNNMETTKIYDLYYKRKVKGDKKLIYRSDLTRKFEYKITKGEKVVSPACKYYKIDQICELNILNEIICIVNYQENGLTMHSKSNYYKNPNGNIEFAKTILELPNAIRVQKFKQAISFIANSYVLKKKKKIKYGKGKIYTIICYPLGILYGINIKYKNRMEKKSGR